MKFEVDGTEYVFVQSPTFGEARAIEKVTGVAFAEMADVKNQSVDFMQALLWVSMRRVNPEMTFDDLDDIDMGVLAGLQAPEAPEVPTDAEDATTSAPSD
jgi:hypothetical protein